MTMYSAHRILPRDLLADLHARIASYDDLKIGILDTLVRRDSKLEACPSHNKSIRAYAPESNADIDYLALAAEILGGTQPHE